MYRRAISNCGILFLLECFGCNPGMSKVADIPLQTIMTTEQVALNPCFDVKYTGFQTPDHVKHEAVRIVCGGIVSWPIPSAASSFKVTLWRPEGINIANGASAPPDVNPVRVRFYVDGKVVADTTPRILTPPEVWTIPVSGGKVLSVRLDQELRTDSVFLADAAFSSQLVSAASKHHILSPGTGYANIGNGPRQIAFYDYYAGETVPVQAEFAGNGLRADITIKIHQLYGGHSFVTSLAIPLRPSEGESIGNGQWKAPLFYGPSTFQMQMSVNGQPVYYKSVTVAISKQVDISAIKDNNFGINLSTSGDPLLQDDFAHLMGAKWSRIFLRWDMIEAQHGKYNWTMIDSVINSYLQQHFAILGVMGEIPPKWMTQPETQLPSAYAQFVKAALEHFRGKIRYWDVYNEIDSKFYTNGGIGFNNSADPQGDIKTLRQEMEIMQQFDPSLVKVCCSTGDTAWLQYYKRIFDAGLVKLIDIVSMHPYQTGPPEYGDNGMSYIEMVQHLQNLVASYGVKKPVWSTEANWLIGPAGMPGVTAPDVTEHQHSQYVVRVNLLSLGMHVPYFLLPPFFTTLHREVFVDSLASYAAMASVFSDVQNAKILQLPEGIYGISASTKAGIALALWTTRLKGATVHVGGIRNPVLEDIYGNPMPYTDSVILNDSPIYIIGGGVPMVSIAPASRMQPMTAATPEAPSLPPIQNWIKGSRIHAQNLQNGIHISASAVKYDSLIISPAFHVSSNGCYVIRPELTLHQGGVGVVITDLDMHKNLKAEYMYAYTGNDKYAPAIWISTKKTTRLQIIIQAGNGRGPANTEFDLTGVQISPCP